MRRWSRRLIIVLIALDMLVLAFIGWYQYQFPYGYSHCCDMVLSRALEDYAEKHGGWYPRGEFSPEASLSLLYREDPYLAHNLRGKTVSYEAVRTRLEQGELLTADTCGWHYVEGLRSSDDARLALFWDKVPLGHNGQRNSDGGHTVWFVRGHGQYISGSEWQTFLEEQQKLREELKR
jgi:hypothetical protein